MAAQESKHGADRILGHDDGIDGKRRLRIKWRNGKTTSEPEGNLERIAPEMLYAYKKKCGIVDKGHQKPNTDVKDLSKSCTYQ